MRLTLSREVVTATLLYITSIAKELYKKNHYKHAKRSGKRTNCIRFCLCYVSWMLLSNADKMPFYQ